MEESIPHEMQRDKMFSHRAFFAGTFFGGPLVGTYLFAQNFKALEEPRKVTRTWLIGIAITFIVFGISFFIPEDVTLPSILLPAIYAGAASHFAKKLLEEKIKDHVSLGGKLFGNWRVFGVTVIGLLVTTLPFFGFGYVYEVIHEMNTETLVYGEQVQNEIAFNKRHFTAEEINELAEGFEVIGYFDEATPKYVYAKKDGSTYVICISVYPNTEEDTQAILYFHDLRERMISYLVDKQLEIHLVVDYLDNVVKVIK